MPTSPSNARRASPTRIAGIAASLLLSVLLFACGGGGTVEPPATRPLPADLAERKAVAYSPFRTAATVDDRAAETITAAMIKQDLDLLLAGDFRLIRLFDSTDQVAKLTLQVIRDHALDMKVMLGIYVQAGDPALTNAEIARGIALANTYDDIVIAVSVGNETMVSWSFNRFDATTMRSHIQTVRDAVRQPVTTDDNWAFFALSGPFEQDPRAVLEVIDFVAMHTYPLLDSVFSPDLWDWRQASVPAARRAEAMMDAAIERAKFEYQAVRNHLDSRGFGALPIVIGETGWKAPTSFHAGRSHPVNQKMYFDRLAAWKAAPGGPLNIFYFEAFDEPWKQGDDGWGLFNVQRQARYVIQDLYPGYPWAPGSYTLADAAYVRSLDVRDPVTAPRYTVYADAVTPGEARPVLEGWNFWENGSTGMAVEVTASAAPGDPTRSIEITPTPQVWGWGATVALPPGTADDLTAFARGTLNFSIRTTYPGRLEVGFYVGSVDEGNTVDVYLPLASGEHGYANDGAWHAVSIPIATIVQHAAAAIGTAAANIDLGRVTNAFVIADRYSVTGKAQGAGVTTKIQLDAIYWAR